MAREKGVKRFDNAGGSECRMANPTTVRTGEARSVTSVELEMLLRHVFEGMMVCMLVDGTLTEGKDSMRKCSNSPFLSLLVGYSELVDSRIEDVSNDVVQWM